MKYITTFTILLISIQATAQIFPKQICVGSVVSLKAGDSISKSPFSCSPISIAKIDASGDIHGLAPGVVTIFYKNIKGNTLDSVPSPLIVRLRTEDISSFSVYKCLGTML